MTSIRKFINISRYNRITNAKYGNDKSNPKQLTLWDLDWRTFKI